MGHQRLWVKRKLSVLIWVSVFVLNFSWSSAGRRRTVWVVVTVHPECLSYNVLMIPFLSYQFRPRVCFRVLRILFDWFLRTGLPISDLMSGWALQLGFYDCQILTSGRGLRVLQLGFYDCQILTSGRGLRVGFCNPQIWCYHPRAIAYSLVPKRWLMSYLADNKNNCPFQGVLTVWMQTILRPSSKRTQIRGGRLTWNCGLLGLLLSYLWSLIKCASEPIRKCNHMLLTVSSPT